MSFVEGKQTHAAAAAAAGEGEGWQGGTRCPPPSPWSLLSDAVSDSELTTAPVVVALAAVEEVGVPPPLLLQPLVDAVPLSQ